MSSTTFESLRLTLKTLRRRRNGLFLLKQGSYFATTVSLFVLLVSGLSFWFDLSKSGTILLFLVSVCGFSVAVWHFINIIKRRHTDDLRLAHYVEDHIPDLEQRLLTSLEFTEEDLVKGRAGVSQQFIRQLWSDAQYHVKEQQREVETVAPARASWISFGIASVVVTSVLGLFIASDSLFNSVSRLAWPFSIDEPLVVELVPLEIEISVEPGDIEMQRGESVTIVARVSNAAPDSIVLRLQDDNVNWQNVSMRRDGSEGGTYSYFVPSLEEDTTYYVTFDERGEQSSPQFRINLFDLPQIEQIDVAFDYPEYTGMQDTSEEDSGDIFVPEGTIIDLRVTFNKPIAQASINFEESKPDDEDEIDLPPPYEDTTLTLNGNIGNTRFTVNQDGIYRISATDFSDMESPPALDYFIRSIEDNPPELALIRPGKDEDVMPLEEVVLEIDASDDYGLSKFDLNYSVVGAEENRVNFLSEPDVRNVSGSCLLYTSPSPRD